MKIFQLKPTNANVVGAAGKPDRMSSSKIGTRSLLGLRHLPVDGGSSYNHSLKMTWSRSRFCMNAQWWPPSPPGCTDVTVRTSTAPLLLGG